MLVYSVLFFDGQARMKTWLFVILFLVCWTPFIQGWFIKKLLKYLILYG